MMLLTKELLKRFAKVGSQEDNPDPLVICKYFYPAVDISVQTVPVISVKGVLRHFWWYHFRDHLELGQ